MLKFKIQEADPQNYNLKIKLEEQYNKQSHQDRNSNLQEIYFCSCGKQYQSFPATYLHFRSKHNIKLSTKSTERRRVVQIQGGIRKIKYLADINVGQEYFENQPVENNNSQNQDPNLCQEAKMINACVIKYLKSSRHSSENLYLKLVDFFNQICLQNTHPYLPVNLDKIPYFLNDFTLIYLPNGPDSIKIGSHSWKQACIELSRFCNWLRKQKYTELILIYQRG